MVNERVKRKRSRLSLTYAIRNVLNVVCPSSDVWLVSPHKEEASSSSICLGLPSEFLLVGRSWIAILPFHAQATIPTSQPKIEIKWLIKGQRRKGSILRLLFSRSRLPFSPLRLERWLVDWRVPVTGLSLLRCLTGQHAQGGFSPYLILVFWISPSRRQPY